MSLYSVAGTTGGGACLATPYQMHPGSPASHLAGSSTLEQLEQQLNAIRLEMLSAERRCASQLDAVPAARRDGARNLIHYMAMRQRDQRSLQTELAAHGLSSLGRAESQSLRAIETVRSIVRRLARSPVGETSDEPSGVGLSGGRDRLDSHTLALLGPAPPGRDVRIMVTMPTQAAEDYTLVRQLLASGMDCMRINAAHDDATAWDRMLRHLDRARLELAKPCRVLMDIAGPKLRTGAIQPLSPVIRWRPDRDRYGRVLRPARIWLTSREQPRPSPEPAAATLPVSAAWLSQLTIGDTIKLSDARDSMRELRVVTRTEHGVWSESHQTAYVVPGTMLHLTRATSQSVAEVGELPPGAASLRLSKGDTLILRRDSALGTPAVCAENGDVLQPAAIGITLPAVFDDVRVGEPIWLDDGNIGGIIRTIEPASVQVTITHTKPGGAKLRADKGVNLPASGLKLAALTDKDREDLRFIDERVHLLGYSFVGSDEDVFALQSHLSRTSKGQLGIVLKIETRRAFEHLPALLIAAMHSPSSGVMIARGDLAVECGYERLAEVQEEILWMAEASHTPVIWATQVLENLANDGVPSRAEITDAAMSERAECVMLNKGPYIVDAVQMLDGILTRMQAHQHKKSSMLRELALARRFFTTV